jgi:hypothetical protein
MVSRDGARSRSFLRPPDTYIPEASRTRQERLAAAKEKASKNLKEGATRAAKGAAVAGRATRRDLPSYCGHGGHVRSS